MIFSIKRPNYSIPDDILHQRRFVKRKFFELHSVPSLGLAHKSLRGCQKIKHGKLQEGQGARQGSVWESLPRAAQTGLCSLLF